MLDLETRVMTWNANGLMASVVGRGMEVAGGLPSLGGRHRWCYFVKALKRLRVDVAGVQETHITCRGWADRLREQLSRRGFESEWILDNGEGRGLALIWQASKWKLIEVRSTGPRDLYVTLEGFGVRIGFLVGHAPHRSSERMTWWRQIQRVDTQELEIGLMDHNSVMAPGVDSATSVVWWDGARAREVEQEVVAQRGWVDAWTTAAEAGTGFTRGTRRIDRIHVSSKLAEHVGRCFVHPIGWSDHRAVVTELRTPVARGSRWRIPNNFWLCEPWTRKLRERLSSLQQSGFGWWETANQVIKETVVAWQKQRGWPEHVERGLLVARSVAQGDVAVGVHWLTARGALHVQADPDEVQRQVKDAVRMMKDAVVRQELEANLPRLGLADACRALRQLRFGRKTAAIEEGPNLITQPTEIAQRLRRFWEGVRVAGRRSVEACREWVEQSVPPTWRQLGGVARRPLSMEVVLEALKRLDGNASPGWDGVTAKVFQQFPDIFAPKMWEIVQMVDRGQPLPAEWTVAICVHIPKEGAKRDVTGMRPISLQQCALRWLTTVLLVVMEDVVRAVVPPCQAAFVKGRRMEDHIRQAEEWWRDGDGQAFIAIDFAKAYDTVSFGMVDAVMELIGVPKAWRDMYVGVLQAKVWFAINGWVVQDVEYFPAAGIRQGDAWSPAIFSVIMSVLAFKLRQRGVGSKVLMFADDVLVGVPSSGLAGVVVRGVLQEWGEWTGLRLNESKTVVLLRELESGEWNGWQVVPRVKYLGAWIGRGGWQDKWKAVLEKVWERAQVIKRLGVDREAKVWLLNSWLLPATRIQAVVGFVPEEVCRQIEAAMRMALRIFSWTVPLRVMFLARELGGLGLWSPSVYLRAVTAIAFAEWTSGGGDELAGNKLQEWMRGKQLWSRRAGMHWVQPARACWTDAPTLGDGLQSIGFLRRAFAPGGYVELRRLEDIPLWNSWVVQVQPGRALHSSRASPDLSLEQARDGERLKRDVLTKIGRISVRQRVEEEMNRRLQVCLRDGRVRIEGDALPGMDEWRVGAVMQTACQWRWHEPRQSAEVWKALRKWTAPPGLKDFIWVALWKKTPVKVRLQKCGISCDDQCVCKAAKEDWLHVVKGCERLRWWFSAVFRMFGYANVGGMLVEVSRLIVDHPLASLQTVQGALAWAGVWQAWLARCDVVFGRSDLCGAEWGWALGKLMREWGGCEAAGLSQEMCRSVAAALDAWMRSGIPAPRIRVIVCRDKGRGPKRRHVTAQPVGMEPYPPETTVVYTDGACTDNGKEGARAGIGVWFADGDPRNVSEALDGPTQTNNRAELTAALRAIALCPRGTRMQVRTDSRYVLLGVQGGAAAWERKRWRTSTNRPVANRDLWETMLVAIRERGELLSWLYVRGHVGEVGNERADRLAVRGAAARG